MTSCPPGGPRCPADMCDCFIDLHPDNPDGLHPEHYAVQPVRTPVRIQLRRTKGWRKPEGAVVVARPTIWGNPWRIGSTGWVPINEDGQWSKDPHPPLTREQAVDCFRLSAVFTARQLPGFFEPLRGKDLACWCPLPEPGEPDICHASILLELANS